MDHCKSLSEVAAQVVTLSDVARASVDDLLARYGLILIVQTEGEPIKGSFWGESEAGIVGHQVFARRDTPIHSLLHETCHTLCMTSERREQLDRDAGGDDLEEAAVCYLQILLADEIDGVGRDRLMADMDRWGYNFRLGSAATWLSDDAVDARAWLLEFGLITAAGRPTFKLRT